MPPSMHYGGLQLLIRANGRCHPPRIADHGVVSWPCPLSRRRNSEAESNGRGAAGAAGAATPQRAAPTAQRRTPPSRSAPVPTAAPAARANASAPVRSAVYTSYTPSSYSSQTTATTAASGGGRSAVAANGRPAYTAHRYGATNGVGSRANPSAPQSLYSSSPALGSVPSIGARPSPSGYRPSAAVEAMLQSHRAKAAWQASRGRVV